LYTVINFFIPSPTYTNDNKFNATNVFTSRKSIEIPTYIEGVGEEYYENGGAWFNSWKEVSDYWGGTINAQIIDDVRINDVSINRPFIKLAKKYKCDLKFPLLYHFQIIPPTGKYVYNWYPTTGTSTKQDLNKKYSFHKVGYFNDFEELLKHITHEIKKTPTGDIKQKSS